MELGECETCLFVHKTSIGLVSGDLTGYTNLLSVTGEVYLSSVSVAFPLEGD